MHRTVIFPQATDPEELKVIISSTWIPNEGWSCPVAALLLPWLDDTLARACPSWRAGCFDRTWLEALLLHCANIVEVKIERDERLTKRYRCSNGNTLKTSLKTISLPYFVVIFTGSFEQMVKKGRQVVKCLLLCYQEFIKVNYLNTSEQDF